MSLLQTCGGTQPGPLDAAALVLECGNAGCCEQYSNSEDFFLSFFFRSNPYPFWYFKIKIIVSCFRVFNTSHFETNGCNKKNYFYWFFWVSYFIY
jgi:hypothetical protein